MSKELSKRIPLRVAKQQINHYHLRPENFRECNVHGRGYYFSFPPLEEKADVSVSIHIDKKTIEESDPQQNGNHDIDMNPDSLSQYICLKSSKTLRAGTKKALVQLKFDFDKSKIPKKALFFLKIDIGEMKFVTNRFSIVSHQNQITDKNIVRVPHKNISSGSGSSSDEDKKKHIPKQDHASKIKRAEKTLETLQIKKEKLGKQIEDIDIKIKKAKVEIEENCSEIQTKIQKYE
jgi:hypothetical protein